MILGLVRWMQPVHGYDVRRELMSWQAEEWANIAPGSIYHALRKLSDEGLLEEVATEQVGARPARTTYRVTPKGEIEFDELLRRFWWEYQQPIDPFLAGFSFLPALPRREAAAALRNRGRLIRASVGSDPSGSGSRALGGYAMIGTEIPTAVALENLRALPASVSSQMPEMGKVSYALSEGKVLLVNPRTRIVVGIIE